MLPAVAVIVGIIYIGIGYAIFTSLLRWDGITPSPPFIGSKNYVRALHDPVFWAALEHTFVFAVVTISFQMVLGFAIAALLRTKVYGGGIVRTVIFIPVVLSSAVIGTTFRQVLAVDGPFNQILRDLHLGGLAQAWLADPHLVMYTIAAINVFQYTGYSFVVFDAALSQIDPEILEAARVDGAGTVRTLRSIVIPMLTGTVLVLTTLGVIGALKTFDIVFLTTNGGPGYSSQMLTTLIYRQAIDQFNVGYASALSVLLVLISAVFAVVQIRAMQRGRR